MLMLDRERESREQSPSAAVIDSQSVKAAAAKNSGFDAGKKVVGPSQLASLNFGFAGRRDRISPVTAEFIAVVRALKAEGKIQPSLDDA